MKAILKNLKKQFFFTPIFESLISAIATTLDKQPAASNFI